MKTLNVLLVLIMALGLNSGCSAQSDKNDKDKTTVKADKINVYYFHYSRRCATCSAVESVSKDAIAELYGDKVTFSEINLDEKEGEQKGAELEVSGQTLLIVADDTKINITSEGFMNARTNPDKLKNLIKEKIDPFI